MCEGLGIGRSALDSLSVPGPLSASTQHMCVNGSVLRLLLSVRGLQSLSTIQTLLFLGLQSSGAPLLWLQTKKVERDRERKIARQRQRQTETKRQRQRERCTCTHMHTHAHTCTHMHTHDRCKLVARGINAEPMLSGAKDLGEYMMIGVLRCCLPQPQIFFPTVPTVDAHVVPLICCCFPPDNSAYCEQEFVPVYQPPF